ncbi:UNVERIFIED_CONTAM: hypothetical protein GTU68_003730 [Idotea baltica]|nr:hypothetical protein [Idotea baltica]
MNLSSKLIEQAVTELNRLPGIGKKTALRLALHLLNKPKEETTALSNALVKLRTEICYCKKCFNIADTQTCSICEDKNRNHGLVCVVESMRDVIAIENTNQYRGVFHVLGGVISPIDGIGPDQLKITNLITRIEENSITEIVLALSPTMEGDTTNFYLSKQLTKFKDLTVTTLARGVSFGGDLQYVDEVTLARSLAARRPYEQG